MAYYQHPDHEGLQLFEDNGLHLGTSPVNHGVPYRSQPPPVARAGPENHQHHPNIRPGKRPRDPRIYGLRKATFWLALALAVVVIIAAVAGGVHGSIAMNNASHSNCSLSNAAILNTASEAAKLTVTQTATQVVTQTATETTTQTVTRVLTHDSILTSMQISTQISTQIIQPSTIQCSAQSAASNPVVCPSQFDATGAITNLDVPAPNTVRDVLLDCPNLDGKSYTASSGSRATFTQLCNHTWMGGSPATGYHATIKDIVAIISYSMDDCMEACSSMNQYAGATACAGVSFKSIMSAYPGGNCWLKDSTGPGNVESFVASAKIVPP